MTSYFIVDTDGGTDDALALLMLIGMGKRPDAITTCFGNVGLEQATINILDTVAIAGDSIPVHMGADRPMVGPLIDATDVHGGDGLGGVARPEHRGEITSRDAVGLIRSKLQDACKGGVPVEILTLGPLTNLARVLGETPELAKGIKRLWIMGATCRGRGNVTISAEFNIYCDPEAAEVVFGIPCNTLVIPWEPCLQTAIPGAAIEGMLARLPKGPLWDFSRGICDYGRQRSLNWYDEDNLIMPDTLAAACVLDEEVSTRTMVCGLVVETGGAHSRGATFVDHENKSTQPPVGIVEKADRTKLEKLFEMSLQKLAKG
ncbi:nucleoside hydrolase [Pseudovibrio exalbescens]|uniref:nucleoside hydrolase n=1 Tax=Pseudovibrio exalbescens TaxID=197461 RepID=UPI0023662191|nr:nucleoside hydrolase [Pseudovibrio exalbescens]MDD7910729.1 nucleoside hydrolase [Pseudovibrio exalbescens]